MTTGYDIEMTIDNEYGFFFNNVIKGMAMKKGGLIGGKWDVGLCVFECPDPPDEDHDHHHEWVFLTVTMFDGKDSHHITLHREDIEKEIDRRRLRAWENQEPAWPHTITLPV